MARWLLALQTFLSLKSGKYSWMLPLFLHFLSGFILLSLEMASCGCCLCSAPVMMLSWLLCAANTLTQTLERLCWLCHFCEHHLHFPDCSLFSLSVILWFSISLFSLKTLITKIFSVFFIPFHFIYPYCLLVCFKFCLACQVFLKCLMMVHLYLKCWQINKNLIHVGFLLPIG